MFSQACVKNFVREEYVPHCMLGCNPPPYADTPLADTGPSPPGQTPPPLETATAADGTHPTGMHSCYSKFVVLLLYKNVHISVVNWLLSLRNKSFLRLLPGWLQTKCQGNNLKQFHRQNLLFFQFLL